MVREQPKQRGFGGPHVMGWVGMGSVHKSSALLPPFPPPPSESPVFGSGGALFPFWPGLYPSFIAFAGVVSLLPLLY